MNVAIGIFLFYISFFLIQKSYETKEVSHKGQSLFLSGFASDLFGLIAVLS